MEISNLRKIALLRNQLNEPLRFNPFVLSKSFFLWLFIGLVGGAIAGLYWTILEGAIHLLERVEGLPVIALMTGAGLLAGLVIHYLGDPGEMDLVVNNIRFKGGRLEPRNNPSMFLSSLLCISAGGSAGPEAPLVQITGSTGTWLARKLRIKGEDVRTLTLAGMASGFTALFGAPLGGSLFALEILHHRHVVEYYHAIIPALVASCSSYLVFILITHIGLGPTWFFPAYEPEGVLDFFMAMAYALPATALGWYFIYQTRLLRNFFHRLSIPVYVKMAFGGLVLGLLAYAVPLTRYFSHHEINQVLDTPLSAQWLLVILLAKILAIGVTVTSGWRGGFIIPLFFVGATLGLLLHQLYPGQNVTLVVVSCMAAINACVTRTPLSTTVLLATLTGFSYFMPILFASLTGFFLAPRTPLINAQLGKNPFVSGQSQKQHQHGL